MSDSISSPLRAPPAPPRELEGAAPPPPHSTESTSPSAFSDDGSIAEGDVVGPSPDRSVVSTAASELTMRMAINSPVRGALAPQGQPPSRNVLHLGPILTTPSPLEPEHWYASFAALASERLVREHETATGSESTKLEQGIAAHNHLAKQRIRFERETSRTIAAAIRTASVPIPAAAGSVSSLGRQTSARERTQTSRGGANGGSGGGSGSLLSADGQPGAAAADIRTTPLPTAAAKRIIRPLCPTATPESDPAAQAADKTFETRLKRCASRGARTEVQRMIYEHLFATVRLLPGRLVWPEEGVDTLQFPSTSSSSSSYLTSSSAFGDAEGAVQRSGWGGAEDDLPPLDAVRRILTIAGNHSNGARLSVIRESLRLLYAGSVGVAFPVATPVPSTTEGVTSATTAAAGGQQPHVSPSTARDGHAVDSGGGPPASSSSASAPDSSRAAAQSSASSRHNGGDSGPGIDAGGMAAASSRRTFRGDSISSTSSSQELNLIPDLSAAPAASDADRVVGGGGGSSNVVDHESGDGLGDDTPVEVTVAAAEVPATTAALRRGSVGAGSQHAGSFSSVSSYISAVSTDTAAAAGHSIAPAPLQRHPHAPRASLGGGGGGAGVPLPPPSLSYSRRVSTSSIGSTGGGGGEPGEHFEGGTAGVVAGNPRARNLRYGRVSLSGTSSSSTSSSTSVTGAVATATATPGVAGIPLAASGPPVIPPFKGRSGDASTNDSSQLARTQSQYVLSTSQPLSGGGAPAPPAAAPAPFRPHHSHHMVVPQQPQVYPHQHLAPRSRAGSGSAAPASTSTYAPTAHPPPVSKHLNGQPSGGSSGTVGNGILVNSGSGGNSASYRVRMGSHGASISGVTADTLTATATSTLAAASLASFRASGGLATATSTAVAGGSFFGPSSSSKLGALPTHRQHSVASSAPSGSPRFLPLPAAPLPSPLGVTKAFLADFRTITMLFTQGVLAKYPFLFALEVAGSIELAARPAYQQQVSPLPPHHPSSSHALQQMTQGGSGGRGTGGGRSPLPPPSSIYGGEGGVPQHSRGGSIGGAAALHPRSPASRLSQQHQHPTQAGGGGVISTSPGSRGGVGPASPSTGTARVLPSVSAAAAAYAGTGGLPKEIMTWDPRACTAPPAIAAAAAAHAALDVVLSGSGGRERGGGGVISSPLKLLSNTPTTTGSGVVAGGPSAASVDDGEREGSHPHHPAYGTTTASTASSATSSPRSLQQQLLLQQHHHHQQQMQPTPPQQHPPVPAPSSIRRSSSTHSGFSIASGGSDAAASSSPPSSITGGSSAPGGGINVAVVHIPRVALDASRCALRVVQEALHVLLYAHTAAPLFAQLAREDNRAWAAATTALRGAPPCVFGLGHEYCLAAGGRDPRCTLRASGPGEGGGGCEGGSSPLFQWGSGGAGCVADGGGRTVVAPLGMSGIPVRDGAGDVGPASSVPADSAVVVRAAVSPIDSGLAPPPPPPSASTQAAWAFRRSIAIVRLLPLQASPLTKVAVLRCCLRAVAVEATLDEPAMGGGRAPASPPPTKRRATPIGADDLIPRLCFVIAAAATPGLFSDLAYLEHCLPEELSLGEDGYAVVTLRGAAMHVVSLGPSHAGGGDLAGSGDGRS